MNIDYVKQMLNLGHHIEFVGVFSDHNEKIILISQKENIFYTKEDWPIPEQIVKTMVENRKCKIVTPAPELLHAGTKVHVLDSYKELFTENPFIHTNYVIQKSKYNGYVITSGIRKHTIPHWAIYPVELKHEDKHEDEPTFEKLLEEINCFQDECKMNGDYELYIYCKRLQQKFIQAKRLGFIN